MMQSWVCCQLGAREHYSIPRALQRAGCLELLVTDLWTIPRSLQGFLNPSVRQRYHADLETAHVSARNWRTLAFEAEARARWRGWKRILERNRWFGQEAKKELRRCRQRDRRSPDVVF